MKVNIGTVAEIHLRKNLPVFRVGDQIRVTLKIVEGESERLQAFEGTVIRLRGTGLSKNFTIRKISYGIGVERTIPLNSPRIEKVDIMRSGHVRRAKLYFLRKRTGRAARLDEKVDHREEIAAAKTAAIAAAAAAAPKVSASPAK